MPLSAEDLDRPCRSLGTVSEEAAEETEVAAERPLVTTVESGPMILLAGLESSGCGA